ncbi:SDR family oxidoreductase [Sphingomonas oligophenolica]|uniref:SDR family oxidoreductase n=1 Tax=Sphingomonas oligophenolica TaxID=301154 RepID=A0A502CMS3_9SPHN|nr:SDR family oxidoreductase [Sphingomonas oligophenolica]TPG14507.1 SDR family oxidoreductase [Sphingomonas oligophenolica]
MATTVLVTGGAKRLGAIIVRRLAAEGHRVVIHYRSSGDAARDLATAIGAAGVVEGDLADTHGLDDLFARARAAAGGAIDALVNSASAFEYDTPPALDPDLLDRLHAIGHAAPALLASALARQDEVREGAVVNILDQKIANLNPDFYAYTAGKLALAGATTMLAQALGPRIRVNAVAPGLSLPSGDQTEEEFRSVAAMNLLERPVDPADIADAVAFLIGARGITGQTIFVDGGQRFCARDRDVMFERARG